MNTVKRIAKNTAVVMGANTVSSFLSLILVIYIARILGDEIFGKYSFALSFTMLFMILSDLGLNILTIREVARDKGEARRYLGNIIILKTLLSLATFSLIFIVINIMNYPRDTTIAVYILGLYWILNSFSHFFRSIFRAFEQMEYEALTMVMERILIVSLGMFVLFSGYGLLELVSVILFAGLCGIFVNFLIVTKKFAKPKFEVDLVFWKNLIKTSLPFALAYIFVSIYGRIDIVMLSLMKGDAIVGWYNAAYVMITTLAVIPTIFVGAIFPVMSRFFRSSKESLKLTYEKSFKYLLILGLPIAVGTTILADRFILLIYGKDFINSVISLKILIWVVLLIFLNILLATVLNSINRQILNAYITSGGAFVNIILNLLLIPPWSHAGAAIATMITEIFVFVFWFFFVSRFVCKIPIHKIILKPLIVSFSMGVLIYYFRAYSLFLLLPTTAIFYFGTLYLIKGFSKDDISLFKDVIRRK